MKRENEYMKRENIELVVVGHTVIDSIVFKGNKDILPGGSGPAVATSAAENGINVGLVTRIGHDFPKSWIDLLKKNIDVEGIEVTDGETSSFFVDYADDGNVKDINISLNVSKMFANISFPKNYKNAKILHICPLPLEDQLALVKSSKNSKISSISIDFNQVYESQYKKNPDIIKELLRYASIIFPNEIEAKIITGIDDVKKSAEYLYNMGAEIVVIKLGARGSIIYDGKEFKRYPPNNISKIVDPTGCGDAFIGGFLSSQIKSNDLNNSINNANIMAAKKIKKKGAWMLEI